MRKLLRIVPLLGLSVTFGHSALAEITGNAGVSNNYIWRGLTQTTNEPAISGGIDYAHESGFYVGTWASNVQYAADDIFSYEHDVYFGYSGGDTLTWDIGWLYYNYDSVAEFDFHEIYGSIGYGGFSAQLNLLSGTEADEGVGQDFGFGSTYYLSLDYEFELENEIGVALHLGQHAGDFNEAFNGVPDDYIDYSVSFSFENFSFMLSQTDLDDAGPDALDNDEVKFVVSYSFEFSPGS